MFTFDNKDYLVMVDYFSRYFEVDLLPTTTSISIIQKLKTIFARHGIVELMPLLKSQEKSCELSGMPMSKAHSEITEPPN